MAACVFCSIIAGDIPAHWVLDTETVVAFLDHRPLFEGHTLVMPRRHVETLRDLDGPLRDDLFARTQAVAAAVQDGTGAQGSFVAMNNVVSQSVPAPARARRAPHQGRRPAGVLLAAPALRQRGGGGGRGGVDPTVARVAMM